MKYCSMINQNASSSQKAEKPAFFTDFNLEQIIQVIGEKWDDEVKKYYYDMPLEEEITQYRRGIYEEIKKPGVYEFFCAFLDKMKHRKETADLKEDVEDDGQRTFLHIREIGWYVEALESLAAELQKREFASEGMLSFCTYLRDYLLSEAYENMKNTLEELQKELGDFRIRLIYEREKITVAEGSAQGDYEQFLKECFPDHEKKMKSPYLAIKELTELEKEIISIFRKNHKEFFKKAGAFQKQYADYINKDILLFGEEITYYLSFYRFEKMMMERGYEFAVPKCEETKDMEAVGLYDLALACVNLEEEKNVIDNDMVYKKGESFLVVTGPNQGGKTTFARSLGQLVYFAKMGLDVPAVSANVPYFSTILTHFSVEESVETGRGKLMEELMRLEPMMKTEVRDAFVVINELFTTAANYDACIMGKKVLEHFIDKGCKGIYVTHLNDLASCHEKVVSMRAMLNDQKVQTFKIARSDPQELAGAGSQVKKYQLTYAQIKERFS